MRRSSSWSASSINWRLRCRWKETGLPSLVARAVRMAVPLKVAWVRQTGQNRRWSSERIQRPTRALLPTPLGPLSKRTERKAAVWLRQLSACWAPAVSSQSLALTKPKGTAVAPHCRARRESWASLFIGLASWQLAVEMAVYLAGQAKALATVIHFYARQAPRVKAQTHLQAAQRQIHLVELIVEAHGAVLAHQPQPLGVEEPLQVQVRV